MKKNSNSKIPKMNAGKKVVFESVSFRLKNKWKEMTDNKQKMK